jgi:hypothetical protein
VKPIGSDALSGAPGGQGSYRREARTTAALPPSVAAPALIGTWEAEGWVILAFEDIEGTNPALPGRTASWHGSSKRSPQLPAP